MTNVKPATRPKRVIIFDLDGTLMPTQWVDNVCFWQAVHDVLGGAPEPVDLHVFEHVTDTGVLNEWLMKVRGQPPLGPEVRAVRQRFLDLTRRQAKVRPQQFRPTPGIKDLIDDLLKEGLTALGVATGGWGNTARFKLEFSGLDRYQLPLASSEDAVSRTGIMRKALQRTLSRWPGQVSNFPESRVVYFGDGCWDLEASRQLGWRFIGIATGENANTLSKAGAERVIPDFRQIRASSLG